ncbi:hypothetical protein PC41400_13625 [Paenibacillus chitinolyticus]|uniref:Uncharacterized protein n=1 Tax=Paenibacillus chitinolyticus TaxID=79263 RepID=A0A410WWJ6_9BACL|nr:hypothetical protein PC41400_13625 [Paenibacillus chitinolyticus]
MASSSFFVQSGEWTGSGHLVYAVKRTLLPVICFAGLNRVQGRPPAERFFRVLEKTIRRKLASRVVNRIGRNSAANDCDPADKKILPAGKTTRPFVAAAMNTYPGRDELLKFGGL